MMLNYTPSVARPINGRGNPRAQVISAPSPELHGAVPGDRERDRVINTDVDTDTVETVADVSYSYIGGEG